MPSSGPSFSERIARLAEEVPGLLDGALRTGGHYADLFYEHTAAHRLTWTQQARPEGVAPPSRRRGARTVEGVGLRVLGERRTGFAATSDLSRTALAVAAEDAAARLDRPGPRRTARQPASTDLDADAPPDAPDAVAPPEKEALVRSAAEAALSFDTRVCRVDVRYHDRVRRVFVGTSDGVLRAAATPMLGLRVAVTLATPEGTVTAHAITGGPYGFGHFFDHPPEQVARAAVERARRLVGAAPLPGGTMPVVLAAGWGGVWLHEAVGHLLEADVVAAGASPFAGCRGRPVVAPSITLVDDATLPGGRGTQPFDDEGTPAARTPLIEGGVLRGFLTDRATAAPLGLPRTGNGRRQDYRHEPLPRMTNLVLLDGDADPADLTADVTDGLFVQALGHGAARPGHGFALDVLEGYRIERGRRAAPVAGARLSGALRGALNDVVGVGRDGRVDAARGLCEKAGQVVPVSVGMPTVLIRAMRVEAGP